MKPRDIIKRRIVPLIFAAALAVCCYGCGFACAVVNYKLYYEDMVTTQVQKELVHVK